MNYGLLGFNYQLLGFLDGDIWGFILSLVGADGPTDGQLMNFPPEFHQRSPEFSYGGIFPGPVQTFVINAR